MKFKFEFIIFIITAGLILNTYYDGRIRKDLIPKQNMAAHMKATNSKLVYKKYVFYKSQNIIFVKYLKMSKFFHRIILQYRNND